MLKSYLTIAYRNLKRRKGYAAINVFGLAVGIACCFLIVRYVRYELSYDDFHAKADHIYRVVQYSRSGQRSEADLIHSAQLAPALEREFPGVAEAVRISQRWGRTVLVTQGDNTFYEEDFFLTDPNFFDVFSFPLLRGNPETALAQPFSVVLTEATARKYFGDENPIGQTIRAEGYGEMHELEVTGVAANPPSNSHFQFDFLVSFNTLRYTMPSPEDLDSWFHAAHYTYVLLEEGVKLADFRKKVPAFMAKYQGERIEQFNLELGYRLQPITDIHLYSHYVREMEANSDIRYVYIFASLALLILIVACINYMNLATAQSARRAREVGIRKVVGAYRLQLIRQFLGESVLLCLVALFVAFVLAELALPLFNNLTGLSLSANLFGDGNALVFLSIGVAVALLAGSYPAFYLSAFQPVRVLKGRLKTGPAGSRFRKGLVVFQFAVAVVLIAGTILIQRQLHYMQTKRLGLNKEHVVVVHAHDAMTRRYQPFKQELLQYTGIAGVTASSYVLPTTRIPAPALIPEGVDPEIWRTEEDMVINFMGVDSDFAKVMEIPIIKGHGFRPVPDSMEVLPVLINETAARAIGWEDPIGKTFQCCFRPTPRVVGVVRDFHYQTLKQRIQPLVLMVNTYGPSYVMVRVRPGDLSGTLDYIREQWTEISDAPFEYTFLNRRFDEVYRAEKRMATVFGAFAFLAVFIACLGLFGLAAYAAERRTKEIGIRKVLGASVSSIVALLSKDFLKLIIVAFIIAVPVAYFAMQRWLQDFAYRIELGPWVFIGAGALVLLIALATVSYQAVKAALTNPVEALRDE